MPNPGRAAAIGRPAPDSVPSAPNAWWRVAEITVGVAFAISQPLYAALGENAAFLAAHRVSGARFVWFALAVLVVPVAALGAVSMAAHLLRPRLGAGVHAAVIGGLASLAVVPHLNRALGLEGPLSVVVLLAAAGGAAVAFVRYATARRLVRFGVFAPALFLGSFLFVSPASALLDTSVDPSELVIGDAPERIVWVVFDQFPLSFLVDADGQLRADRYPNIDRLAEISTWYPNTSSISSSTSLSVPAALTGRIPDPGALPVASVHPENAFTLLAGTYDVFADEYVTQLCPDAVCQDRPAPDSEVLWRDTWAVLVRQLLADDVADRFVPSISGRWHGFGDLEREVDTTVAGEAADAEDILEARLAEEDDRVRWDGFLDGIAGAGEGASFHYIHLFQPHEPLRYLPDGRSYDPTQTFLPDDEGRWPEDQAMLDARLQGYVAQTMYVDTEIGELLDVLESTGDLDDTLLVVMSDHGMSMLPGTPNRVVTPETADDVLPVPVFVKLPGQDSGRVDDRLVQQTDLLPTVLDALGADLGDLDGESLLQDPVDPSPGPIPYLTSDGLETLVRAPDARRSPTVAWIDRVLPRPSNPFAAGANAELFGTAAAASGDPLLSATVHGLEAFSSVDLRSPHLPVNVTGTLEGADAPVDLAVALNGRVAGTGRSYDQDGWQLAILIDPALLHEGANRLELVEVVDGSLRPISTG